MCATSQTGKSATRPYLTHLESGLSLVEIALICKKNRSTICRVAKKYEREGLIRRILKYPAIYEQVGDATSLLGEESNATSIPTNKFPRNKILPHRFGCSFTILDTSFKLKGGVQLKRRNWNATYFKFNNEFSITVMRYRVHVWLHVSDGTTVKDRIHNGIYAIRVRAKEFEKEQGLMLKFEKLLSPLEWVLNDKEATLFLQTALNLKNESIPLPENKVRLTISESHPNAVHIARLEGEQGDPATEVATRLERLLKDQPELYANLEKLTLLQEGQEKFNKKLIDTLEEIKVKIELKK